MKTFVQTAKEQHAQTGAEIMRSLRMSDQEHNNHLFESGISFLQKVFGSENEDFRLLAYDRRFWNWYRSEWHFAQKNWLDKARTFISCPITAARELYIQHIHYKCVMSRSMYDSFDTWLKLQIETLKKETICTQTT
ncbi:MAG: hypothetical protein J0G96_07325 [Flavobacteriia bacterium]|nr:hypothetical protein [Flavobacteriia bacterium]OJX36677.1 MAG: hypothetical protein BGO87_12835 [Flavobacteriia bacterium 40-80]